MKRFAHTLLVASFLLGGQSPSPASADKANRDVATFDGLFGGTISKFDGTRKWQPSLWLDATWGPAGPLHIGAYFQWLGRSFPLDDPGFGGGGVIALRGDIKSFRMTGAFTGGYLGVPLPAQVQGTGTIGALAGLGYGFLSWMGFEVRGRWSRYFRMPDGAPSQAWTIEAGFSFFVK